LPSGQSPGQLRYGQRPPSSLVPGDGKEVELVPVVVVHQPGGLLDIARFELAVVSARKLEVLLPPCDQRLFEPAADRFARMEPQGDPVM
jgi:hypothetical protein